MNYYVRKFLSKIGVYLCAVMLLNVISPCISFATDSNMANIENDTSVNEYIHTSYGTVYSKYILDENNSLSKNLFLNDACISEGIIDFCVDNQYIAYSSDDSLYLYDFQDGTSDNICTDVQLRDLMFYSNYIYGVNDSEGLSQLYVIDSGNKEIIKTNYTNVNSFTVSDDGLNIDMKLPASKLDEIGADKIDVSTYSAVADAEEINDSNMGLDNIIHTNENNISLFSIENLDMPVLMATVTLSSLQPAMFVMDTLYVTQGAYSSYSHSDDNAFDLDGSLGGGAAANVKAPFDGKIKYKANESKGNCHAVWFESNSIVQYANGNTGYMTVLVMHDDDISNVYEGQSFSQGQTFYQEGSYGLSNVTGQHLHLECINGTAGSYAWHKRGNVYPNDALYLYSNTNVQNKGGYTWRVWSGVINKEPPTSVGMICNYENMTINPGTQIQLDFWYSNGDSFDIIIDKDGSEYQRFNNVTSPFYYTPTERGNYIARGYAKNSVGSTESNRRAFYVKYVNAPTSVGMICNYENMTVKPGTQIQLDFWYSNGDSFDIVIDRNGVEYQRFNNVGSPFYYTPTEEGNYLARGYAKNEAGATESNRRAFYVSYSEPPTNVGMVCNYENMSVKPGTAIEFSYWYHNGNSFDVIIYRNNVEYERLSNVSNPFYYVPSEEGNYLAVGYAKNSAGATESNRRAFNVLSYVPPIPNGTYSILSSLDNSYALNVYARDPGDNNTLIIWQDPSQKFDVTYIGGGLYKIISSVTGKALCARDSGMSSGTDLVQYTWNGSLNQKWRIETTADGYFYIVNCLNGLYVDVDNSNASNGTNVWLYEGNSSYAQKWLFTPLTYTISYNANGGENAPTAQIKNHRQNLTLSNITPSKTGYDFLGWSENPNAQSASYIKGATFTGNYNVTLYAIWKPKQYYLDVNGLLDNVSASNTDGYGTFDLYVNGTLVADDVCDSYHLCNYGDSYQISDIKNSVGRSYNGSSSSLVGNITYTTIIELQFNSNQYTVNFNASGGNLTDLSKNVTYNSQYGELPTPIRKGYSFKGWYTASSGGNEITNTTMVTNISNHTLYAQWEKLIPDTNSSVIKKGTTYLINVVPIDIDESCDIIIAGYKGGKFITLTKVPYIFEEINTTLSGDIDEIKVMVWNNLSELRPLCDAEVIPSSKFIVE